MPRKPRDATAITAAILLTRHLEIAELDAQLTPLVARAAPRTTVLLGISTGHAGQLLTTAGEDIDRLRGEAAFAALCGASPTRSLHPAATLAAARRGQHPLRRRPHRHHPTPPLTSIETSGGSPGFGVYRRLGGSHPEARKPAATSTPIP